MLCWRGAIERAVNAMLVVVIAKCFELAREVDRASEKGTIQKLAPNLFGAIVRYR
jgi:hypothetical protein